MQSSSQPVTYQMRGNTKIVSRSERPMNKLRKTFDLFPKIDSQVTLHSSPIVHDI